MRLFTHNDLDGIGSVILSKIAFGEWFSNYKICDHKDINDSVIEWVNQKKNQSIFITDISVNEDVANKLDIDNTYLFDHHPTAMNLKGRFNGEVSENIVINGIGEIKTCGTELYYNWLLKNGLIKREYVDSLVNLIRNYDTWRWVTLGEYGKKSKQLNDLFYFYGEEKFIERILKEFNSGSKSFQLNDMEKIYLESKQREIDEYVKEKNKNIIKTVIDNKVVGIVYAENFISELGNELCKLNEDIDYIAIINMDGKISFRTVKDNIHLGFDVASKLGGGGHAKAAGASFDVTKSKEFAKEIFG